MAQLDAAVAIAAAVILSLGLVSAALQGMPLSRPLLALAAGVAVGPQGLGWLRPDAWGDQHLLLTLGMLLMWALASGIAYLALGVAPTLALLIGAAMAPTDPVVASSIVTGSTAEETLPRRTRSTLSLESGANDGLAYLIVMLPVLMMPSTGDVLGTWLGDTLLRGVLLAVALGVALGLTTGVALRRAHHASSILSFSIALSLLALSGAHLAGSDGILAAFAAGVAFNAVIDRDEEKDEENVQEAISKLFSLPIFILLGAALPWAEWAGLGAGGVAMAAAVLLLRRPVTLALLGRFLGAGLERRDVVFLGWFGPVGVAAMYYALLGVHETGETRLWAAVSLVVTASVVAHGITSGPGLRRYRRGRQGTTRAGLAPRAAEAHPTHQSASGRRP